jgi:hypothetical protein
MDGKGRWMDNVFIERLWRSVKYEEINCTNTRLFCAVGLASIAGIDATTPGGPTKPSAISPLRAFCKNRPKAPSQPVEASALIAA